MRIHTKSKTFFTKNGFSKIKNTNSDMTKSAILRKKTNFDQKQA